MLKPIRLALFALSIVGCSSAGSQTNADLSAMKTEAPPASEAVVGALEASAGASTSTAGAGATAAAEPTVASEPSSPEPTATAEPVSERPVATPSAGSSGSSSASISTSAPSSSSPAHEPTTTSSNGASTEPSSSEAAVASVEAIAEAEPEEQADVEEPTRVAAPALTRVLAGSTAIAAALARAEPPRAPATAAEVYSAVASLDGLRGWTVVPLGHFQRGEKHVVVAWPAMNSSGAVVDATVVGICLEETVDGLEECGRRWVVRESGPSRSAIAAALGGSDYRTLSGSAGASLDDLGPRLSALGSEFVRAAAARNGNAARRSATSFVQMLPLSRVAYDDDVAQLLYLAARYNGRLEHVRTVRNGETAELTFRVVRSGFTMQTVRATARPVSGSSDRWIIVSYS